MTWSVVGDDHHARTRESSVRDRKVAFSPRSFSSDAAAPDPVFLPEPKERGAPQVENKNAVSQSTDAAVLIHSRNVAVSADGGNTYKSPKDAGMVKNLALRESPPMAAKASVDATNKIRKRKVTFDIPVDDIAKTPSNSYSKEALLRWLLVAVVFAVAAFGIFVDEGVKEDGIDPAQPTRSARNMSSTTFRISGLPPQPEVEPRPVQELLWYPASVVDTLSANIGGDEGISYPLDYPTINTKALQEYADGQEYLSQTSHWKRSFRTWGQVWLWYFTGDMTNDKLFGAME